MFKELFVASIVGKIKKLVAAEINISLNQNNMNINENLERADKVIFEVLMDILGDKNTLTEDNLNYNFFLIDIDKTKEDSEHVTETLKCQLLLYYTALYFDNVDLLRDLLTAGIYDYNDSSRLTLCFLDKDISDLFGDDYLEIIQRAGGFFRPFYRSIKDVPNSDRKKYLDKFSKILKERKDCKFYNRSYGRTFVKENLDILDLDSYLALTEKQLMLLGDSNFRYIEDTKRLNSLMQNPNYSKFNFGLSYLKDLFNTFNDSELLEISENMEYFGSLIFHSTDEKRRIFNLYKKRKIISNYSITKEADFLKIFSDDEILNMSVETLEFLENNIKEKLYFANKSDSKNILKSCNKALRLANKMKKKNKALETH